MLWSDTTLSTPSVVPGKQTLLDLAAIIIERVIYVHGGRICRGFPVTGSDRLPDGIMLLHRLGRVTTDRALQPDYVGLGLQPACLAHGDLQEHVVGGIGDG